MLLQADSLLRHRSKRDWMRPMTTTLDSRVEEIISRAASEIVSAVRTEIANELLRSTDGKGTAVQPARRGRPPKAKGAAPGKAPAKGPAAKGPTARRSKGRRPAGQVAMDDARLLDYVRNHPGLRSEDIVKAVGLRKQDVASGLQRLRETNKVKMKGIKRAATYTAA
jgi:hypothetical protein